MTYSILRPFAFTEMVSFNFKQCTNVYGFYFFPAEFYFFLAIHGYCFPFHICFVLLVETKPLKFITSLRCGVKFHSPTV